MTVTIRINGEARSFATDPMRPLLDLLREDCLLTGTKSVCREGFCGACTVHLDGAPVPACLVPVGLVGARQVTTIEGLGLAGEAKDPLQLAFVEEDAVQCGMCFPGMVMGLGPFLDAHPAATAEELRIAMTGNLCRCTGYERIIEAALKVLETRR
jgi:carbon-monoxide dehydrogenase small subunit